MLIIQFHPTKSLSYNSIHQVYGENACHTIFIHFRKTIEKNLNHFCGFLRTVEQTGDKKELILNFFFEKNACNTISIYDTSNFENWPQQKFLFLFQAQIEFCTQTNIFRKKIFCMPNLSFRAHNVVLDTIILAFFLFTSICFSKTLKIFISFEWRVYVCLDQCLIN